MKKITLLGCVVFFAILTETTYGQNLVINEFLASNSTVNADEDGDHSDWVELYNNTSGSINLEGYGLSDDTAQPFKWLFPDVEIGPGSHLLVWCSDKNRTTPNLPLHTNWKISADGEMLSLTQPDGTISDQIGPVAMPTDVSYGRTESGSANFTSFTEPTPGYANSIPVSDTPPLPPVFSSASGLYADSFELNLTHDDPTVTILYTLDGSQPEITAVGGHDYVFKNQYREFPGDVDGELLTGTRTTFQYQTPINLYDRSAEPNDISGISTTNNQIPFYIPVQPVLKSMVVRARAVKDGLQSDVVTRNYFISQGADFTLPIVCINANEDELFDYYEGIHVAGSIFDDWRDANPESSALFSDNNYTQSGDAWEIKANFSLYDNADEVINQDIGLRINGGFSRNSPNKSLRLYARSEYGVGDFSYPIFGDIYPFDQFKRLILRNSGNDNVLTYFRDAFIQRAVQHLHVTYQPYRPAIAFLNGEYWGMLNFTERYDDKFFERVYDINPDDLDFLEYDGNIVQEGNSDHYQAMLNFVGSNSMQDASNYAYINTQMDVENFTDFYIANIYADNTDWPHNNTEFWRKRTSQYVLNAPYGQDGRWRWVLKDMDFGFGATGLEAYMNNTLAHATAVGTDLEWSTFLFRKLLDNQTYRQYFINRFADMINTTYLPQRLLGMIDEMKDVIAPEITRHGQRWNIFSMELWLMRVDVLKEFSTLRPGFQRQHIQQKFGLEGQITATIDVNDMTQGHVKINTIDVLPATPGVADAPYPWTGVYFKSVPVTLTAIPADGYEFAYWSGVSDSVEPQITVNYDESFSVTAHFTLINPESEIPISFWLPSTALPFVPLQTVASSFEIENEGILEYKSCYEGYPFLFGHPLWRKGAMERANSQTDLNYIPEANFDIPFEDVTNMRGLKVKSPFQVDDSQSMIIFKQSTLGFDTISGRIAAKNESDGPTQFIIDYSTSEGDPAWTTDYLPQTIFDLTADYQLFNIDFSSVQQANNNPNFKFRIRFAGDNVSLDNSGLVLFNNISISGKPSLGAGEVVDDGLGLYPNPTSGIVFINQDPGDLGYAIFSTDGRQVRKGTVSHSKLDSSGLQSGLYLLTLTSGNAKRTFKIIKE